MRRVAEPHEYLAPCRDYGSVCDVTDSLPPQESLQESKDPADWGVLPGVLILLTLLVAPAAEIRYDASTSVGFERVVAAIGPSGWPRVLTGMLLTNVYFATFAAVAVSIGICDLAMRRGVDQYLVTNRRNNEVHASFASIAGPTAVLALLFLSHGWLPALLALIFVCGARAGQVRDYVWRRRGILGIAVATKYPRHPFVMRFSTTLTIIAFAGSVIYATDAAVDGRAWGPVEVCKVSDSSSHPFEAQATATLIEITRDGTGVVGYRPDTQQVTEGRQCVARASDQIRGDLLNSLIVPSDG